MQNIFRFSLCRRLGYASPPAAPQQVIGHYSLSAENLDTADLPKTLQQRLPRYPVPVVLLGRLAVVESPQGKGLGSILLADARQHITQASQVMAVCAVVVDALNDRAAGFYQPFGFIPLPGQPRKPFLPMDSVSSLIELFPVGLT